MDSSESKPMKNVLITGSTRGIGRGLATEFARRHCKVFVTGRSKDAVDEVVAELGAEFGSDNIGGCALEISSHDSVQQCWDTAAAQFGTIDVWINNAGMSIDRKPLWEHEAERLQAIANTNLTGMLFTNKVAISQMLKQGSGQVWNMEGFGSDGRAQPGMTSYGATKRAVNYLNKSLKKEVEGTSVQVCTLSPGIVVTELLTGDYDTSSEEWQKTKKVLNILADTVETVTPYLAEGVLAADKNGAKVAWLTNGKAFKRFMTAAFNKRDVFADAGFKDNSSG